MLGTSLSLDGTPHVVIGVMPRHFRFPADDVQLLVPFTLREADFENRRNRFLEGVARLGTGVAFEKAPGYRYFTSKLEPWPRARLGD
ncbi:MAG: hypothetical protein LC753_16505 [Acidobacteria bacterium]|nr:hypothetical protein [Acidobacteriota bacterium]MCA1651796.1 hypothetical protein [Acidobacteriota bacterium]